MCVYVYMCVCVHVYVYIYTYTYTQVTSSAEIVIFGRCILQQYQSIHFDSFKMFKVPTLFHTELPRKSSMGVLGFLICVNFISSRPEVLYKKGVIRNSVKFTGKHVCQSLFFNKV